MKRFLVLALKVVGGAVAAVVLLLAAFGLVMFVVVNFGVLDR
ncbi:hypothetical protein [Saccharopolyspora rosea]|uniref:Uncharacterized protein n=1 Tax=Saccharopolyspora rosea TaxID=524884 RepID=A0ABW3G476_9PSEU|nr:hypothetical protein [Saccharopolyspora rosea]